MEPFGNKIRNISTDIRDYVETRLELTVLNISERSAWWVGKGIQKLIGFSILGIGSLFLLIALAIWLGQLLDNVYLGYLIVGVPLVLFGAFFAFSSSGGLAKRIQYDIVEDIMSELEGQKEAALQLPDKSPTEKAENESTDKTP